MRSLYNVLWQKWFYKTDLFDDNFVDSTMLSELSFLIQENVRKLSEVSDFSSSVVVSGVLLLPILPSR